MRVRSRLLSILILIALMMTMMPASAYAAAKKPGKSKITSVSVSQRVITVSYKKVKNAKSYKLYRVTYKDGWKYLKKIKSSQKKKYSNTAKYKLVKKGKKFKVYKKKSIAKYSQIATSKKTTVSFTGSWNTTYTLAVRAYNGKKAGPYSSVKSAVTGNAPSAVKTPPLTPAFVPNYDSYETYVFFGSDSRAEDESWKSPDGGKIIINGDGTNKGTDGAPRSDVIMLINVNRSSKTINIVSVYRDTALAIGESSDAVDFQKANKAYAEYGPKEACKVLEKNLDIRIKGYAVSNFKGVADVIDSLGGIRVNIEDEATYQVVQKSKRLYNVIDTANEYIREMDDVYHTETDLLEHSGEQDLNGIQAVAYARVRYTEGSDMRRTQRQKAVLIKMIEKYSNLDNEKKIPLITQNASAIDTNLDLLELAKLIKAVSDYKIEADKGFPYYKSSYKDATKGDLIVPCDLQTNIIQLHQRIYGESRYVPNDIVKKYSKALETETDLHYIEDKKRRPEPDLYDKY